MNKLKIKLLAGSTLLFFSINAFAIFPLIFAAYPAVLTAIEGMSVMDMAVTGSVAIHATALAVSFKGNGAPSGGYSVVLDPNTPLITPAGWQNPNTPPVSVPPDTNWTDGTHTATSLDALGALYASSDTSANASCNCQYLTTYVSSSIVSPTDVLMTVASSRDIFPVPSNSSFYVHATQACRAGYTRNNATSMCDVNDPSAIQKPADNVCQSRVLNGAIVNDIRDPDCAIADLNNAGFSQPAPDTVIIQPKGGTTKDTVKTKPDGSSSVTKETLTPDGNTDVKVVEISAPDGATPPQVTGVSDTVKKGQGTLSTDANITQTINFDKSGLATSAEQTAQTSKLTAINSDTTDILKELKCDNCLVNPDHAADDKNAIVDEITKSSDMVKSSSSTDYDHFENDMGWSTWVPSFPSGGCLPFSFQVANQTVNWNFCPYIEKLNELLGWLFALFGAWTIMSNFFKKD